MISCTEFIPLYSEFFKFLESKGGHDAVVRYWEYVSDYSIGDKTNPNSLASFMEKYGFEGTWRYWSHTLTEEAADCLRVYDPVNKTYYDHMRHCPSKGMLLAMKHMEPYYDYCGHCAVLYSRVLKKYGVECDDDYSGVGHAECESLIHMAGVKPGPEAKEPGEGKIVMDLKEGEHKYLHRDFHLIGDMALRYCGEKYGDNGVKEFLRIFAAANYAPLIEDAKKRGLTAIREKLEKVYGIEEAPEVLHAGQTDSELAVTVDRSPVIAYMRSLGQEPSKYYVEETRTLYEAIADACGLGFELLYYRDDGGAKYRFFKRAF